MTHNQPRQRETALRIVSSVFVFWLCFLIHGSANAAPCDRLSPGQKKVAQKLFSATYPYDCCDDTLSQCLKQSKVCKLAKRLRDDICRRLVKGQDAKRIQNALARRALSMMQGPKKAAFDLKYAPVAGEPQSPVTVVAYACARCPFCRIVVPNLYRLVHGSLKGKVKLHFRPFPIRGHSGSVEGGLAFVAAARLGKIWPYLLKMYSEYRHFSVSNLAKWATDVGIDAAEFKQQTSAKDSRTRLINSKKEGLRNGVDATPTLFINGRKYYGDMDRESLLDVLDEETDRIAKRQFCGN